MASLPAIREALLTAPAVMAAGAEAVRSARRGTRVALLGASLGVPVSAAALALTEPDALVLVDGAADLPRLLRSESKRALGGGMAAAVLAAPLGSLAARLLAPLEPSRYAAPPGMPVLIVDAAREERYPPECVARLHATFPGAARHTHPGPHLRPTHGEAIASIVLTVSRWLERR